jgi:5'-phosphate synthase pdxT subunit
LKIGVLALQGGFAEHIRILKSLGIEPCEIRQRSDFTKDLNGIILPGGESTVLRKLLKELSLFDCIKNAIQEGMPVFGTCAGAILLARHIENESDCGFGAIDMIVRRNAYGRQLGSFSITSNFEGIGEIPMVFIRAPVITSVANGGVEVLSKVNGNITAVRQKNILATVFHPELTNDMRVHEYFLSLKE